MTTETYCNPCDLRRHCRRQLVGGHGRLSNHNQLTAVARTMAGHSNNSAWRCCRSRMPQPSCA